MLYKKKMDWTSIFGIYHQLINFKEYILPNWEIIEVTSSAMSKQNNSK